MAIGDRAWRLRIPLWRAASGLAAAAVLFGVSVGACGSAAAQGVVRSVYGDWQIRCETPPGAQSEQCALMQSVTAEDRPNVGLTVIVLKTADQKARVMRVVAPLGVMLPSGLGLKIDDKDVGRAGFVKCLPSGCIAEVDIGDLLILRRPGSPSHSVEDIIQAARKNPGKLKIGTMTAGSTENFCAEFFTSTAGIEATIVPFSTPLDLLGAVMRGDIDVAFEFYGGIGGLLADKKVVALASTGAKRTAYLPDVPTVMESGVKNYECNLIKQLSNGHTSTFIIFQSPEEGIGFPMSLKGFGEGYNKLP